MKAGLRKSDKVISRLNSLNQKDDLKIKFEELWIKISKIHQDGGKELENLTIKEQTKMKKRRSMPKHKIKKISKFINKVIVSFP
jgi:hypothetical protein